MTLQGNVCAKKTGMEPSVMVKIVTAHSVIMLLHAVYIPILCYLELDSCLSSPCSNGSTCINLGGNDSYACMCVFGFEGVDCGRNVNECTSNPCKNGGICRVSSQ